MSIHLNLYIPDNRAMHLLIPFAFCSAEACGQALRRLDLPHVQQLLSRLTPQALDAGDVFSLSPPHERALARASGLPVTDGLIPWAALQAGDSRGHWGFITPCHWQIGAHHIAMGSRELPDFSPAESQALLAAMRPYFEEDGLLLHEDTTGRWLAQGELLADLATASLDRIVGRNLENWMPRTAKAAPLRRLQSEMQMLLYTHPVNEARLQRGLPAVNSFWLSGTGSLPASPRQISTLPEVDQRLRDAALQDDWAAWASAWQQLDAQDCAALLAHLNNGEDVTLTLCGERHAQTFTRQPRGLGQTLKSWLKRQPAYSLIETL
jgi:hypothetical protein